MQNNNKIVVVLPAYNAEKTLEKTYSQIPFSIIDEVILVDDASNDKTVLVAEELGIKHILKHDVNLGYGGNQKTCYNYALSIGADIVIMLHPDYQYTPALIESMASVISNNVYSVVIASRILGNGALKGGMPVYKYFFNRILTLAQNIIMNKKLSEYHSGYRAFSKEALSAIKFNNNSNDFVFDNQIIAQLFYKGFNIAEISCPTLYTKESSSINFMRSCKYGIGCMITALQYRLSKWKLIKNKLFE